MTRSRETFARGNELLLVNQLFTGTDDRHRAASLAASAREDDEEHGGRAAAQDDGGFSPAGAYRARRGG